jgi:hypothetical protein
MVILTRVLFGVASLAEVIAVLLIIGEMKKARMLAKSSNRNILDGGNAAGQSTVDKSFGSVVEFLLKSRAQQTWAVVLILVGICCGIVGNFLALVAAP